MTDTHTLNAAILLEGMGDDALPQWLVAPDENSPSLHTAMAHAETPIGTLDCIRPNQVQVIASQEQHYLQSMSDTARAEFYQQLIDAKPLCILLAEGLEAPKGLVMAASPAHIPVLGTGLHYSLLIRRLSGHVNRLQSDSEIIHGVFMEVQGVGLMLTGKAAAGKSELALELLTRGHRLIADDAPEFTRIAPNVLIGSCPELLREFLEVRGLGVINVRSLLGDAVVRMRKRLELIVELVDLHNAQTIVEEDRLNGSRRQTEILGVSIPVLTLPVAAGRNLAVLIETAARDHILRMKGYNAAQVFQKRLRQQLQQPKP